MAAQDERTSKKRGIWGEAVRERFLALLRETGNAAAALRIVGHPNMFRKRRRRDPAFAADWAAAVAEADARLGRATGRLAGGEAETVAETGTGGTGTVTSDCPQLVIRRTRGGRTQIALARECEMDAADEADFLARLRATGNFSASARAVGFQPASLFDRYRKWPAFARDCDAALVEAEVQLDFALVAHAHRLLRKPGEEMGTVTSDCPPDDIPFDPEAAMRILAFIDRRRGGRTTRGARKGPPERLFDEAVASVLAKIAAIERHEKMKGQPASPPLDGEDEQVAMSPGHGFGSRGDPNLLMGEG